MPVVDPYYCVCAFNVLVGVYIRTTGRAGTPLAGVPFVDAFQYLVWQLAVPLPLFSTLLVKKLDAHASVFKGVAAGSAQVVVCGYSNDFSVTGKLALRWDCWFLLIGVFPFHRVRTIVGLETTSGNDIDPSVNKQNQVR